MKLVQVKGYYNRLAGGEFPTICKHCHKKVWHDPQYPLYVDLEGKPFEDYYCGKCAHVKMQLEETQ
jgi:hypothetical protein